jgi:hypothetical protein
MPIRLWSTVVIQARIVLATAGCPARAAGGLVKADAGSAPAALRGVVITSGS